MAEKQILGVLFVDDNPKMIELLKKDVRGLEGEYRFHFDTDPERALQRIVEGGIHIVFADYVMPGMDGVEFLRKVRSIDPAILRIVITAYGDIETTELFVEEAEVYGLISKPWSKSFLYGHLEQAREAFFNENKYYVSDPWAVVLAIREGPQDVSISCKYPGVAPFDAEVVAKKVFESSPLVFEDEDIGEGATTRYTLPLPYEKVSARAVFDRFDTGEAVFGLLVVHSSIETWQAEVIDEVIDSFLPEVRAGTPEISMLAHSISERLNERFAKTGTGN